ncbi:MAG: hydantoinase/oxoprolinase family protein, partial [Kiloniellales bacterium]|nr:hydantoinase/oxoprolinase family protein [Kiloniellales bacterium]
MAKLLGIDTGGTYTDAVLFDEEAGVLASAKDLTTKHDLMIGVRGAVERVLPVLGAEEAIQLVSLSTTLATNAIVEGHGAPVCLVLIGYEAKALDKAGLREALKGDPVVFAAGGHNAMGDEAAPLNTAEIEEIALRYGESVAAFAVAGFFGVRNPDHEIKARNIIRERTGLPVTCAHELTSNLDAPRRALTALLNARLIPQLYQLILAVRSLLVEKGIEAPLMVVKGDGSLVADDVALASPVETILSGPAASVVGARYLSGEKDVIVSDIGGTTTDIAVLKEGRPLLDREGARVGGWRTMVEAVRVHTFGLGGDSEVRLSPDRWPHGCGLIIGPRRVVPLSLLCHQHPGHLETLSRQTQRPEWYDWDGRFAMRLRPMDTTVELPRMEAKLWAALAEGPLALEHLAPEPALLRPLNRLVDRGLVIYSAFSPSDAAHMLGLQSGWNAEAAGLGATLLARRGHQTNVLPRLSPTELAEMTYERVIVQTGRVLVEAMLSEEGLPPLGRTEGIASRIVELALQKSRRPDALLDSSFRLGRPLAAIGAPAETYYAEVAERLSSRLVVPKHAEVCNALGAVAGGVLQAVRILISQPEEGRFRAHLSEGISDFMDLDQACAAAEQEAQARARQLAVDAGACDIEVTLDKEKRSAKMATGEEIFVEMEVTATAVGRPRLAAE